MADKEYHRLTRSRSRTQFSVAFMARQSLWLGSDHLLSIETSGYTENYKRFYFRDIQAFIVRQNRQRGIWNVIWGCCVALFLILGLATAQSGGFPVCAVFMAIFLIPLIWNSAAGPTCTFEIRTAVQTEEIPSLNRVRRVRKVLARLRPLITTAQGELSTEEIAARLRETAPAPVASPQPAQILAEDPNVPPRIVS